MHLWKCGKTEECKSILNEAEMYGYINTIGMLNVSVISDYVYILKLVNEYVTTIFNEINFFFYL